MLFLQHVHFHSLMLHDYQPTSGGEAKRPSVSRYSTFPQSGHRFVCNNPFRLKHSLFGSSSFRVTVEVVIIHCCHRCFDEVLHAQVVDHVLSKCPEWLDQYEPRNSHLSAWYSRIFGSRQSMSPSRVILGFRAVALLLINLLIQPNRIIGFINFPFPQEQHP
jgi:hypothetical protein